MSVECLVLITALSSCQSEKTAVERPVQKTFASPEDASTAVLKAAKSGDRNALLAIFGPEGNQVLFSGDPVQDKASLQDFTAAYEQMHRWQQIKAGGEMLYVGADNFIFPIPLGQNEAGQWYFDTAAGKDEILARRIGRDELNAITACAAIVQAEKEYFSRPRDGEKVKQYAEKLVSDVGKQNGLYWVAAAGQPPSPLEDARDFAKALGYSSAGAKPQLFEGYYFRILTKQGDNAKGGAKDYIVDGKMTRGFAVLGYPAEYRVSGIMTFLVGEDGVVYQKDLGDKTTEAAAAMAAYDPTDGWVAAL
jgi:hypothetical protein